MPLLAHIGHDDLVTDDPNQQDFVLTIADVFTLTGRGTAVIGPIESGVLRTGEEVEIWDDHKLITTAHAQVEMICSRDADPRTIGLLLGDVDKSRLAPGQTIRRTAAPK
jgi:elongation factor Tu